MANVPTDLKEREGRVVGSTAYVKINGEVHAFSTLCTHAACEVEWNGGAKTWDCPCHGSRFNADGTVLQGPAQEPLRPEEIKNT